MNELDGALIPVIHGGSSCVPHQAMDMELFFYITQTLWVWRMKAEPSSGRDDVPPLNQLIVKLDKQPNNWADVVNSYKVWKVCNFWKLPVIDIRDLKNDFSVSTGCSWLKFYGPIYRIVFSMRLERMRGTEFFNEKDFWESSFWICSKVFFPIGPFLMLLLEEASYIISLNTTCDPSFTTQEQLSS